MKSQKLKTSSVISCEYLGARIQSGDHTQGYEICGRVSVAVVTAQKYGLGLRQIRILTRENTACRARRNMRWPIPPIYSLCTTTSFLSRGHKGPHAFSHHHHHFDQLKAEKHCNQPIPPPIQFTLLQSCSECEKQFTNTQHIFVQGKRQSCYTIWVL